MLGPTTKLQKGTAHFAMLAASGGGQSGNWAAREDYWPGLRAHPVGGLLACPGRAGEGAALFSS
jgi:hypothetical protein